MSEQSKDELALVLRRISALSQLSQPTETQLGEDGIPVLDEVYEGGEVFSAVEIEQLLAPYYDPASGLGTLTAQVKSVEADDTVVETQDAISDTGIKFLPAEPDDDAEETFEEHVFADLVDGDSPQLLLARQELAETVMADMQPLIAQAIKQALVQEIQALAPRLSAEVEQSLADSLRDRITQALKNN